MMKSKEIFIQIIWISLFVLLTNTKKVKRQIFREEVLPKFGGKIPESAFWTERLALNVLNAKGIYSTGIYLQNRHHSDNSKLQVRIPKEQASEQPPDQYLRNQSPTVDTTYLDPETFSAIIKPSSHQSQLVIPYNSLKLRQYYNKRKTEGNKDSPWNEVENSNGFSAYIKKEYEPYLKKLHEVD